MKNVKNKVFLGFGLEMLFASIFIVIFVISKSKYVGIQSFKAIRGDLLSELTNVPVARQVPVAGQSSLF